MDKGHMKALFVAHGLPTGAHVLVRPQEWRHDRAAVLAAVESLRFPVFVKPCRAGSSVGITKVAAPEDVAAAIEDAARHDPRVIVESGIAGREIECGVLEAVDGGAPDVSVPGEILVGAGHEFYDFSAKYLGGAELAVPADVPAEASEEMTRLAAAAFEALGCEGLARVDFFLTGDGTVLVNEVNTMPGFTPSSMFPQVWAATGLDYPALIDRLLQTALCRPAGLR
jgi:D-alanine-D-alanine ligase